MNISNWQSHIWGWSEKAMAPHSSTLAWKIPWMEEPGGLQSMGVTKSQTQLSDFTFSFHFHALEKEMAAHSSIIAWRIPGTEEPSGLPSMGSHRVRHDWSDLAAAAEIKYDKVVYGQYYIHVDWKENLNKTHNAPLISTWIVKFIYFIYFWGRSKYLAFVFFCSLSIPAGMTPNLSPS